MRTARTTTHTNSTRVDHAASRTHGLGVRIQWQGQRRAKVFSGSTDSDRLAVLAAASDWRNATEQALGKPRTERQVVGLVASSSGIPGVRRVRAGDTTYYEATCGTTAGKQARTTFSMAKHGTTKALQLAKQAGARSERSWRTTVA